MGDFVWSIFCCIMRCKRSLVKGRGKLHAYSRKRAGGENQKKQLLKVQNWWNQLSFWDMILLFTEIGFWRENVCRAAIFIKLLLNSTWFKHFLGNTLEVTCTVCWINWMGILACIPPWKRSALWAQWGLVYLNGKIFMSTPSKAFVYGHSLDTLLPEFNLLVNRVTRYNATLASYQQKAKP